MKNLLFLIITCNGFITQNICTAGGYADTITLTNEQIQRTANQRAIISGQSNGAGSSNTPGTSCQSCASTNPATASMPYFIINWYGSAVTTSGTAPLLSSFTFPTNQIQESGGFWVNNAILTIHLFPPSNIVTAAGITPINGTTNSYAIMYTLRSMDGNIIQKAMQYPNSTTTTQIMPIATKGAPQIPTSLSISTIPVPTTPPANPTPTPTTILDTTPFLPTNFSTNTAITQQRILNAISPFSQKFLINSNSGSLTVIPLSGTFDTDDGTTLVTSFAGQSTNLNATNGTNITQLQVILSDDSQNPIQNVSFGQKNNFTTKDLQNGLALNVHIFPPSTSSSQSEYIAFATLRTLDGLKLHKVQFTSFTTQPVEISINYGSATSPQFTTVFLNSTAAQNLQAIGLIGPINLRCLLQKTPGGTFNISML
ncbi:hypothetical protein KBB68_02040 [Candidatus Babeliales bacterium]|nr:hypothetical protein [Candidatus Babeliales bacterium]